MAEIDSGATHNFVRLAILTAHERSLLQSGPSQAKLAASGATIQLQGSLTLRPLIGDQVYPGVFHACRDLRADIVLGRAWLKDHDVHHEHRNDCLYLGRKQRRQIYLTPLSVPLAEPTEPLPFDLTSVPPQHEAAVRSVLNNFEPIFYKGGKLRHTIATSHEIRIAKPRPFRAAPRHYSIEKRRFIDTETKDMLAQDIIEPATVEYSSAIVVANKPGGGYRLCMDYRPVNEQTEDAPQCLPRIHDVLKIVGTAKIFSTMDFKNGYWQIPMSPESRKYTAFSTPDGGQYQFKRMPFGLKNAPGTFQNLMRQVLASFWGEFCMAYLDDIIIFSHSWEEHLVHLAKVLERIQIFGLTCSPAKCRFGQTSLPYLGHVVTANGNEAQPKHIEAIQKASPPRNRKQLASFLGTCNWLMEYVHQYSELTAPLTNLLSVKRPYKWTEVHQKAFEKVQEAFKEPPALSRPDPQLPYVLQIETGSIGMGAVLFQETQTGDRRIISYGSAKFKSAETRYPLDEQTCLTIVWAFKKYRPYLEERPFILRADKKALAWLEKLKGTRTKLTSWHILINEFTFTVEHAPKNDRGLPNALSAVPNPREEAPGETDLERIMFPDPNITPTQGKDLPVISAIYTPTLREEIIELQQSDHLIGRQMQEWIAIKQQGPSNQREKHFYENNYLDERGFWKFCPHNEQWQLRVPSKLKERVLWEYHDVPLAGHPGAEETFRSISEHFFWPKMGHDIRSYVANCHLCLCSKPIHHRNHVGQKPRKPHSAWETIALDLMGPYPLTTKGNRFILVVTDLFTRWVEAFPIRNSHASTIIKILEEEVFSRYGYPRKILSDNGPQFRSNLWAKAGEQWACTLWTTPEYHPQGNPTERRNQEVKKGLRLRLHDGNQRIWDQKLPQLLFGLRRRRNAATGFTPAKLMFGRQIRRPGEWDLPLDLEPKQDEELQSREKKAYQHQTQYQRRYAGPLNEPPFKVGDLVLAKNTRLSNAAERYNARLAPIRTGPYPVLEIVSPGVLWIQKEDGPHKIYVTDVILAPVQQRDPAPQEVLSPPEDPTPATATFDEDGKTTSNSEEFSINVAVHAQVDFPIGLTSPTIRNEALEMENETVNAIPLTESKDMEISSISHPREQLGETPHVGLRPRLRPRNNTKYRDARPYLRHKK